MGNRIFVAMVLVSAACGKGKQQCQADVADLVAFMRSLNLEQSAVPRSKAHLVTRTDLPEAPIKYAPLVDVLHDEVRFRGRRIEPSELAHKLVEAAQLHETSPGEDPNAVLFAVDESVPWQRVAELAELVSSAGFDHIGFVFARPSTVTPPPHTSIDDEMATASNESVTLSNIFTRLSASCKPLDTVASDGSNTAEAFVTTTAEALTECNCDVDLPKFRSASYALLNAPHQRAIYISASRDQGTPLAIAATTHWGDASKQIANNMQTWLQVK